MNRRDTVLAFIALGATPLINMKAAKALGLTIPPSILLRADEVIQ